MAKASPIPVTKKAIQQKATKLRKKIEAETPPQDLQDMWAAVTAIATAHSLIQNGHFTYAYRNAVGVSIAFLEELHKKALADCAVHPKKDLIPELITTLAAQKVRNGETAETTAQQ